MARPKVFGWPSARLQPLRSPWWSLGGDMQTVFGVLQAGSVDLSPWPAKTWRLRLPDGDTLMGSLHRHSSWPEGRGRAVMVMLHGQVGDEDGHNVRQASARFLSRYFSVLRLNLRGAGPTRKLCARDYHSGLTEDLHRVMDALLAEGFDAVGFYGGSLGGSLAVKLAGERGDDPRLLASIAVAPPLDLQVCMERAMAPRNWLYHRWMLRRMKAHWAAYPHRTPEERAEVASVRDVRTFDARVAASQSGYDSVEDFYFEQSASHFLAAIQRPCLIVQAVNDPWVPLSVFDASDSPDPAWVRILLTRSGGHMGFQEQGKREGAHLRYADQFLQTAWQAWAASNLGAAQS